MERTGTLVVEQDFMGTTAERGTSWVNKHSATADAGLVIEPEHILYLWPGVREILVGHKVEWLTRLPPDALLFHLVNKDLDLWCGMDKGVIDGFLICQWECFPL